MYTVTATEWVCGIDDVSTRRPLSRTERSKKGMGSGMSWGPSENEESPDDSGPL